MTITLAHRIQWIDAAKGICILLVVLNHFHGLAYQATLEADASGTYLAIGQAWEFLSRTLGPLRMPMFFFLSGLLATDYVLHRSFSQSMRKRVGNLVWMLVLWGAVQWLVVSLLNNLGVFNPNVTRIIDAIYATSMSDYIALTILGYSSLWYLYALVLYFVICKTLSGYKAMAIVFVLLLYCVMFVTQAEPGWGPETLVYNSVFFLLGAYWGKQIVARCIKPEMRGWLIAAALLAMTLATFALGTKLRFIGSFLAVGLMVWALCRAKGVIESKSLNCLGYLGRNTLYIYILHRLIVEALSIAGLASNGLVSIGGGQFALFWYVFSPIVLALVICFLCASLGRRLQKMAPWLFALPFPIGISPRRDPMRRKQSLPSQTWPNSTKSQRQLTGRAHRPLHDTRATTRDR